VESIVHTRVHVVLELIVRSFETDHKLGGKKLGRTSVGKYFTSTSVEKSILCQRELRNKFLI